jgi:hypothetical protein
MLGLSLRGVGGRGQAGMRNAGPIVIVAVPVSSVAPFYNVVGNDVKTSYKDMV